jgi:hypothetical protein
VRAAWTTEIERARDLEADLSRLRETLAERTAELDRVRVLASTRLGEIDSLNTKLEVMTQDRDAHQEDKRKAWDRLATIERIARQPEVDNELGEVAHRPEPGALAGAMTMIREALKGFS